MSTEAYPKNPHLRAYHQKIDNNLGKTESCTSLHRSLTRGPYLSGSSAKPASAQVGTQVLRTKTSSCLSLITCQIHYKLSPSHPSFSRICSLFILNSCLDYDISRDQECLRGHTVQPEPCSLHSCHLACGAPCSPLQIRLRNRTCL